MTKRSTPDSAHPEPQKKPAKPTLGQAQPVAANPSSPIRRAVQPERQALATRERQAVLQRDGYRCRLCGVSQRENPAVRLEVDHITPISRGGTNDPGNLQTLCSSCNRLKSNKI